MKRIISLLLTIYCTFVYAQEAKTLFTDSPDSITPLLTEVNRADCIDFLESNMKAQVKNKFGSISEMTELSSDYLRIQMTANSTWEMKVLSLNDEEKVICVISTVCAPVCDSNIKFYNLSWTELPLAQYFSYPSMDDFFLPVTNNDPEEAYAYERFRQKADIRFVKAGLSKEKTDLAFLLTTPEYMGSEEADEIAKFIRPVLTYQWKEGRFSAVQ